ncbi:MAG TPA: SMC-Scp complex subunit ScpB [Candidatus Defluviicoccus seviourii]|nr:SMC-Scp complex subunit ScpB [Candidatus Defluviicoccus seviourii]
MSGPVPYERRLLEALLFAADSPVSVRELAKHLPDRTDLEAHLDALAADYAERGIQLVRSGDSWSFVTAPDLAAALAAEAGERKLSRAAMETLAIIAYHQPITRAEIEDLRGVQLSGGTLDLLFAQGWIATRGRRETPGRPVLWGTTDEFLRAFSLERLSDLPSPEDLKAAGLLQPQAAPETAPAAAAEE